MKFKRSKQWYKAIRNVLIVYRPHTDKALRKAEETRDWLKAHGYTVYSPGARRITQTKLLPSRNQTIDLVIAIGGDGTYLGSLGLLEKRSVPVIGVNMGSLGFLTVTRAESLVPALEELFDGKMMLCPRQQMMARVIRKGKVKVQIESLNDVVIERGSNPNLINLSFWIAGQFTANLKADGMIISTSTGSTAYNLASGGPIVYPESESVVLTPICPHSLYSRPLVIPRTSPLRILINGSKIKAHLTVDGRSVVEVTSKDMIEVTPSKTPHWAVLPKKFDYFELLREKLKFGERI